MGSLLLAVIYISFISLGLPDSLLGASWPTIHTEMNIPVSYAGGISIIIAFGTIVSSLLSDRMTRRFGAGLVTAVSVAMTAAALFGFSLSNSFLTLCLWAIPYGLGAGGVDASLNTYVALHYSSRHLSWLHCMWGFGTIVSPYVMGAALTGGLSWHMGYRFIALFQIVLCAVVFLSLPLWKRKAPVSGADGSSGHVLSLREIFSLPGAGYVAVTFFCYCALEQTVLLWASSYFVTRIGVSTEQAASLASLFCIGMTVGRALNGFLTFKFSDTALIRSGECLIGIGIAVMLLPLGSFVTMASMIIIGLGCAPIYPCIIHSTPAHFGAENSQALIGVQMSSAYLGILVMPPLFGLIARSISTLLLPGYLLALLITMAVLHEKLVKAAG